MGGQKFPHFRFIKDKAALIYTVGPTKGATNETIIKGMKWLRDGTG
jgi:hypothetical protein